MVSDFSRYCRKIVRLYNEIVEIRILLKCLFMAIIVVFRLVFIPHALAFQSAAILLPVSPFDKRLTARLAERNIGFTAVVIQRIGIHRHKAGKTEISRIHHRFNHRL